jgi:RNA polymerase sigma-70 factor (ECF subfamily)
MHAKPDDGLLDTQQLLDRAAQGDDDARRVLLERYRSFIRRMVAARLDRRLAPRIDASDIVQEVLADAAGRLDEYLRDRPLSFFGWLRQFASERVIKAHQRHLGAQRRSVTRESIPMDFSDASAEELTRSLVAQDTSPSNRLMQQERREQVMAALATLGARDRDALVMRYLEQLDTPAIAEALGITEYAVKARLLRALVRIRGRLEGGA